MRYFPVFSARSFPGKRVDAYRAGIIAVMPKPTPVFRRIQPNIAGQSLQYDDTARFQECQKISETGPDNIYHKRKHLIKLDL